MILVDSSVWIDYLRGTPTAQVDKLDALLGSQLLGIGDLNLIEVLQGFRSELEFNLIRKRLAPVQLVVLGGDDVAVEAARNYRKLRALGVAVRGTIDVVQATRCIVSGHQLLHSDRDFDAFEKHLGLRCVGAES